MVDGVFLFDMPMILDCFNLNYTHLNDTKSGQPFGTFVLRSL